MPARGRRAVREKQLTEWHDEDWAGSMCTAQRGTSIERRRLVVPGSQERHSLRQAVLPAACLLALALTACTGDGGEPGATYLYRSTLFELEVLGHCGERDDGSFDSWAFTLDASGRPIEQGPHLHAMGELDWSVIDFYPGEGDRILRVYRSGPDRFDFARGTLRFAGATDKFAGSDVQDHVEVTIRCP